MSTLDDELLGGSCIFSTGTHGRAIMGNATPSSSANRYLALPDRQVVVCALRAALEHKEKQRAMVTELFALLHKDTNLKP